MLLERPKGFPQRQNIAPYMFEGYINDKRGHCPATVPHRSSRRSVSRVAHLGLPNHSAERTKVEDLRRMHSVVIGRFAEEAIRCDISRCRKLRLGCEWCILVFTESMKIRSSPQVEPGDPPNSDEKPLDRRGWIGRKEQELKMVQKKMFSDA